MNNQSPILANYMDYRTYLKDFYTYKRQTTARDVRPYSYAVFAAAADIKSPNYLKLVMEGQRNLSDSMSEKFAKALGFSKSECDEFKILVKYSQSLEPMERSQFLKQLSELRVGAKLATGEINSKTWSTIPDWVSWIILQLIENKTFSPEPAQISKLLGNKVTADIAKKALDGLMQSGMLERDPQTGELKKTKQLLDSPQEMPPDMIRKLQSELILLGLDSLFKDSPRDREFGVLTLSLTREEFENLKFEVRHLRKRWQREFTDRPQLGKPERVYQCNIQLFPLSEEVAVPAVESHVAATPSYAPLTVEISSHGAPTSNISNLDLSPDLLDQ